jgi:hypothetical protein
LSLYVDGVRLLTYTGPTTVYASNQAVKEAADVTGVFVLGNDWGTSYVDDLYVDDATGEADAVPPARRFVFLAAATAGTDADWTPLASTNVSQVDDAPPHDSDTTYVKSLAAADQDTYSVQAYTPLPDYNLQAVVVLAVARKLDNADCQLSLVAFDGVDTTVTTAQALGTDYAPITAQLATQPDASAWNAADFNAMEFGFKSAGDFV